MHSLRGKTFIGQFGGGALIYNIIWVTLLLTNETAFYISRKISIEKSYFKNVRNETNTKKIITQTLIDVKSEENLITITTFISNNIFTQESTNSKKRRKRRRKKKMKIFIYVIEPYFC